MAATTNPPAASAPMRRPLGKTGWDVTPLAFGGNVFGWTADMPTSHRLLDAFVEGGGNLIDTADVYSAWVPGHVGGESETILGDWLKKSGKRDRVLVATKVGMEISGHQGLSKAHIIKSVEASLRRLQTDYIDLYQSHRDDRDTPLTETLEAYGRLIKQGKIRQIGASNYIASRLREALTLSHDNGLPAYQTLQPHYNLIDREEFEGELQAVCLKFGLGVIPYFSLASGFLTGKYRTRADLAGRSRGGRVAPYLDPTNPRPLHILDVLVEVAAEHRATPAQTALAWLMHKPAVSAPIVSATHLDQLTDILRALTLDLNPESVARLDRAGADFVAPR